MPTFGSLFSGIGGIDLGLERAGWECRWQIEIDPFCTAVLERHWPDITRYGDIRQVDWRDVDPVDLVAGGFPCQPVSQAGRQKGQADERWLWPEFARAVRGLRPRWVLVENVPGLLSVNGGSAADEVFGDLARYGFDAEWASIPAAAVGAPHLRYRVFVVAHADGGGFPQQPQRHGQPQRGIQAPLGDNAVGLRADVAHAVGAGLEVGGVEPAGNELAPAERSGPGGGAGPVADAHPGRRPGWPGVFGEGRRPEPADGGWWESEPDVGRVVDGFSPGLDRPARITALGNAVVPAVAEWVGRRMMEAHGAD